MCKKSMMCLKLSHASLLFIITISNIDTSQVKLEDTPSVYLWEVEYNMDFDGDKGVRPG